MSQSRFYTFSISAMRKSDAFISTILNTFQWLSFFCYFSLLIPSSRTVTSFSPVLTNQGTHPNLFFSPLLSSVRLYNSNADDSLYDDLDLDFLAGEVDVNRLEQLTVSQLRQQLRLRNLKVSGKKDELLARLASAYIQNDSREDKTENFSTTYKSKAREFAESRGKELVDVSEYLDDYDQGKDTKTSRSSKGQRMEEHYGIDDNNATEEIQNSSPETWGEEAKIIQDYEGRSVIVDGLSRNIIQFKGSLKQPVEAYVVASREALKAFLKGGGGTSTNNPTSSSSSSSTTSSTMAQDLEEATFHIQKAREKALKVPMRLEDVQGEDVDDEEGLYTNILDRDYGDWGKYSLTGVQLSAQETKGVLLLSDVHGPFSNDIQALADKIAFECQPIVVFCPDLFRGNPWKVTGQGPLGEVNSKGQTFEEWRSTMDPTQTSVDIRAAAACMRQKYGVSSISVFGLCYGGGRALEITAKSYPNGSLEDVNGEDGPSHVNPTTCVAWYPTRYDATSLFGKEKRTLDEQIYDTRHSNEKDSISSTAIMAIFAENDVIPGATVKDAALLKQCLDEDDAIKDSMVKIFPGQDHGFAHVGLGKSLSPSIEEDEDDIFLKEEFGGMPSRNIDNSDAEVASLLSTAWIETYARSFLPTVGEAIKESDEWSTLTMPDLSLSKSRNVRQEIEDTIKTQEDIELDLKRMHPDDFKTPIDDLEDMNKEFYAALQTQPYGASWEDLQDPDLFLNKLEAAIDRDDFNFLPGFGDIPLDDSVDGPAYW